MVVSEQWQPRLDINPGDYEVIASKIDPRKARVVHVLCREEPTKEHPLGRVCIYEPLAILPHAIPFKEAWLWYMTLKIMGVAPKLGKSGAHNFLDRLEEM